MPSADSLYLVGQTPSLTNSNLKGKFMREAKESLNQYGIAAQKLQGAITNKSINKKETSSVKVLPKAEHILALNQDTHIAALKPRDKRALNNVTETRLLSEFFKMTAGGRSITKAAAPRTE